MKSTLWEQFYERRYILDTGLKGNMWQTPGECVTLAKLYRSAQNKAALKRSQSEIFLLSRTPLKFCNSIMTTGSVAPPYPNFPSVNISVLFRTRTRANFKNRSRSAGPSGHNHHIRLLFLGSSLIFHFFMLSDVYSLYYH